MTDLVAALSQEIVGRRREKKQNREKLGDVRIKQDYVMALLTGINSTQSCKG